ncbi:ankyrin repeat and fibronectin type-III domain-containing protein 1-like [Lampris incognitus]|uniref:ankyrin repeat and fibronectin type-III domain-containing protein 1-like n=1 Tax=Lampris incognitus TaxID=2546036 RepID=UPI0024B4F015|nr:ankyrin repeat and fibronectin type-III domain-containing protein 1-like [Lampris incognitus]
MSEDNKSDPRPLPDVELGVCVLWLKMSVDSDKSCMLLSSPDSRTSCIFHTAEEKDDIPGVGEDSVLEMLSYSKFSDLETWLCMPSTLLPRALESTRSSSASSSSNSSSSANNLCQSTCSETGETDASPRPPEKEATFLTPAREEASQFLTTPLHPILSSTPYDVTPIATSVTSGTSSVDSASQGGANVRKRRRIAASPGGLHWNAAGSVQRDFGAGEPSPVSGGSKGAAGGVRGGRGVTEREARSFPNTNGEGTAAAGTTSGVRVWASDHAALRKTVSIDDRWLQPTSGEQRQPRLLSRLERGKKKLRIIHSFGTTGRYETRKK